MHELILVAGAHLLAVMSPGPDFALVLKSSLVNGRRAAIYTSLGIALGILVHVAYSIIGIAVIVSQSIVLFNTIKLLGAAYLIWLGYKALKSKPVSEKDLEDDKEFEYEEVSKFQAFKTGFITNVLNPKATLFFLSLFTQVISPSTPNSIKLIYGIEMAVITFVWFAIVATVMTQKPVRTMFSKFKHYIDRTFGVILIALGIKIATGTR